MMESRPSLVILEWKIWSGWIEWEALMEGYRRGSAGPLGEGLPLCLLPPSDVPALLGHPPHLPLRILSACLHPGTPRGHSSGRFTTASNQTLKDTVVIRMGWFSVLPGFWRLHSTRSSNWEGWGTSCASATASLWHCALALHPLGRSGRAGGGGGL